MRFLLLIYADPANEPVPGTPEWGAYLQSYGHYTETLEKDGKYVTGEALEGAETATTVSVRNGKTETMDGPFAETKEILGGYYLVDCADLDEAVKYAALIPTAAIGRVEVRPVMVFDT